MDVRFGRVAARRRSSSMVLLGVLIALLFGASCGATYTVKLSASDIEQALARRLPVSTTKLFVTVALRAVSVEFMLDEDRVLVRPQVEVSVAGQTALSGHALIEGQIRYASGMGELFVDEPKVVDVAIPGLPAAIRSSTEEVIARIGESYLASTPVYRLNPDDFQQALTKLVLKSVKVRQGRLEIVLRAL